MQPPGPRWIALSAGQISIQWIVQLDSLTLIQWIEIYPMDSAIQLLNNWGLVAGIIEQKLLKMSKISTILSFVAVFLWRYTQLTSLR